MPSMSLSCEEMNELIGLPQEFVCGDRVIILHTNPGAEGVIMGVVDPRLYWAQKSALEVESCTNQWAHRLGLPLDTVLSSRIYYVLFDKDTKESLDHSVPPRRIVATIPQDLQFAGEYWDEQQEAFSKS